MVSSLVQNTLSKLNTANTVKTKTKTVYNLLKVSYVFSVQINYAALIYDEPY